MLTFRQVHRNRKGELNIAWKDDSWNGENSKQFQTSRSNKTKFTRCWRKKMKFERWKMKEPAKANQQRKHNPSQEIARQRTILQTRVVGTRWRNPKQNQSKHHWSAT